MEPASSTPFADQVAGAQRDGPATFDDHVGGAVLEGEPIAEFAGVGDGGREGHEAHVAGETEDDLLPDRAAVGVLEEVDLVEDHATQVGEGRRPRIEHVAEDLGGHDDHRGVTPDDVVAREEAHPGWTQPAGQVAELLVGECLEGRRVEGAAPLGEGPVDGVFGDDGLAAGRRGGHEYGAPAVDGLDGVLLEGIQRERPLPCCGHVRCGSGDAPGACRPGSPVRRRAASVPTGSAA